MLKSFFGPQSVALVGSSPEEGSVGNILFNNLSKSDVKLFPVNPKYDEINDVECFDSVLNVKSNIELAVVAVPAKYTVSVLEDLGEKDCKNVVVISAGLEEFNLELEVVIAKYGLQILGPNCLGVADLSNEFNATFADLEYNNSGEVALVSQSGAVVVALSSIVPNLGKVVSLGNKLGIDESDALEYLIENKKTEQIVLYLEDFKNGQRFVELAKRTDKNIFLIKGGRTAVGAVASASHTAALATDDVVFEAAMAEAGVVVLDSISQVELALRLSKVDLAQDWAVVTNAGGPGILASDDLAQSDLKMSVLSGKTQAKLNTVLPSFASTSNPIDVLGDASPERFRQVLDVLKAEKLNILLLYTNQGATSVDDFAAIASEYRGEVVYPVLFGGAEFDVVRSKNGIYADTEELFEVLSKFKSPDGQEVDSRVASFHADTGQKLLNYTDTIELLEQNGLNVVKQKLVKNTEELSNANIEFPVVTKAVSPSVLHKTEFGLIKVKVRSQEQLESAYVEIIENFKTHFPCAELEGVLVQEMKKGCQELFVGLHIDPSFGQVITFGFGGVYVNIMEDVATRLCPLSLDSAKELVQSIQMYPLLVGARGQEGVDIDQLAQVLVQISNVDLINNSLAEADFNPLLVDAEGVYVVDAKFILE